MKKVILLLIITLLPNLAFCFTWQDLWFTQNQQAAKLLQSNQPALAAEKFSNPLWQGYAYYKAGKYELAMEDFSKADTPLANYNRGNALAHLGQYQAAIDAYDKAMQQQKDFPDAVFNKKIVEKLLQQQKKQQQQAKNQQENQKSQADNKQNKQSQANNSNQNKQQNSSNSKKQDSQKSQQQQSAQNQQNSKATPSNNKTNTSPAPINLTQQQQQALKQWLQQIPDNPGGLLKQKFLRDHLRIEAEENQ